MRRKIINCNKYSFYRLPLDTKSFRSISPDFSRFSFSLILLPSINKWKHVCRKRFSSSLERSRNVKKKDWRWRQKKIRVAKNRARIFRNASERNFREIFLEFSFFLRFAKRGFRQRSRVCGSLRCCFSCRKIPSTQKKK